MHDVISVVLVFSVFFEFLIKSVHTFSVFFYFNVIIEINMIKNNTLE